MSSENHLDTFFLAGNFHPNLKKDKQFKNFIYLRKHLRIKE